MENIDSELICPYGVNCKQPLGQQFMDKYLIRYLLTPKQMNILSERAISATFRMYSCPKHKKNQFLFEEREKYQRVICCPNIRICNNCLDEAHEGINCAYLKLKKDLLVFNEQRIP